jgi:hypothetical protein
MNVRNTTEEVQSTIAKQNDKINNAVLCLTPNTKLVLSQNNDNSTQDVAPMVKINKITGFSVTLLGASRFPIE